MTAAAPTPLEHSEQLPTSERPLVVGPSAVAPPYPIFMSGAVQRGFGRGSKDLGCPTANLPDEAIEPHAASLETGVHYGFAKVAFPSSKGAAVDHDDVFPMVMSIGWNPFYKNQKRTAEVHILHEFPNDFYGAYLRIAILGYIRPEYNYTSMDALIQDIEMDKRVALASLDRPAYQNYASDPSFSSKPID